MALVLLFLLTALPAAAQQHILPLSARPGENTAVAIDSVRLTLHQGHTVGLQLQFCLTGARLPRDERLTLVPRLCGPADTLTFAPIEVYGTWARHAAQRSSLTATGDDRAVQLADGEARTYCPYQHTLPYADWMQQATLQLTATRTNGCQDEVARTQLALATPAATATTVRRVQPGRRHVVTQLLEGTAYIGFPVNQTEVLPLFGNNQHELAKLCHVIDSVSHDADIQLRHISIKGYASPEGSYANNERLARERTQSVCQYVAQQCGLSPMLLSTDYEPEDWQGLRRHVLLMTQLPGRDSLLRLIDADMEPDAKLALMARRHPQAYRQLLSEVFPLLRHTDYHIEYTRRIVTQEQDTAVALTIDTLRQLAFTPTEDRLTSIGHRFSTYRPLLAVKTNLLFDAALMPNIEVEVPFGRRWSLMAEDWFPWFRYGFNAKGEANRYYRSDQRPTRHALQLWALGLELRYWLWPRCAGARPTLCGGFVGIYGAGGKYDYERHSTGDQGEFTSLGVSAGYAWPLARRLNLELSGAIGYVGGPRRHYRAEFDDARLIFQHYGRVRYAGPTKLKLSIAWLLGRNHKKGGEP